ERPLIAELERAADGGPASELLRGLFGPTRQLYKRLAQYSFFQEPELYQRLARQPYPWLTACAEALANITSRELGQRIAPHEILIDAPPVKREMEINIDIHFAK